MNFLSNLRYLQVPKCLKVITIRRVFINQIVWKSYNSMVLKPKCPINYRIGNRTIYSISDIDDLEDSNVFKYDENLYYYPTLSKDVLYKNSTDPLIITLNNCASIQEVFNVIKEHGAEMNYQQITQAVLILGDFQKLFLYARNSSKSFEEYDVSLEEYNVKLVNHQEFFKLLQLINKESTSFDNKSLSWIVMNLNKMGIKENHETMMLLTNQFVNNIQTDLSIETLSRYSMGVCTHSYIKSFYAMKEVIPYILGHIDTCKTPADLKLLTIGLDNIHFVVTNEALEQYKRLVKNFINSNLLTSKDYRTILKIALFLNEVCWRDSNMQLVSKCLLLLKNQLHLLTIPELLLVYEMLYKNHEPGQLLNELQRNSTKFLLQLEDNSISTINIKLKLISCSTFFSPIKDRSEYENQITACFKKTFSFYMISNLSRLLTGIKTSNRQLCDQFWDNILIFLTDNRTDELLSLICQRYMNFCNDIHYKYPKFEKNMTEIIKGCYGDSFFQYIPSKLSAVAGFIIAFGTDDDLLKNIIERITDNWMQLGHKDCLHISKGLRMRNEPFSSHLYEKLNRAMDYNLFSKGASGLNSLNSNYAFKNIIYRRRVNPTTMSLIFNGYCNYNNDSLSSISLRNTIFCLLSTNSLIPDLINNLSQYVIENKNNLLAFNLEKLATLCYHMGFTPKDSDKLFETIIDVVLRDQHRLSALSYLQTALALCFFQKLPDSFIKYIFNVKFLENIDDELTYCYFKDIYPVRVRHSMMQLNRTVCLDYPQFNIPWFHQKYIDQLQNQWSQKNQKRSAFSMEIEDYLNQLVEDPKYVLKNSITPYGYHLDFELQANNGDLVLPDTCSLAKKIAVVLQYNNFYTNNVVQLKGQHQLMKRHLEMLGYKVVGVNQRSFNSLICGQDKLEYLRNLIMPECTKEELYVES